MNRKDLTTLAEWTPEELERCLGVAAEVKREPARYRTALAGRTLAMIFEKPSLRTRVTFEAGMFELGGHALYLAPSDIRIGERETVADVAHNLERMVSAIMARTFRQETVDELAANASVPVINGLSDRYHPCQALADYQTLVEERGTVRGQALAYVGDGNNVAHSLMHAGAKLGAHVRIATPEGYEPDPAELDRARPVFTASGGRLTVTHDPAEAVDGADAVYTDVWASMGQEEEAAARARIFRPYQVDAALFGRAKPDAIFLHCLPAHRGEEVAAEVIDSPRSRVFPQAENRKHAQKAVLLLLLGASGSRTAAARGRRPGRGRR
jgi:ornithine carbamoyltransferase